MYMMNEDFLLPAYQKLYAALNSLERFSKGQDLFDNIGYCFKKCVSIKL